MLAEVKKRLDVQQRLIEDEIFFEEGATTRGAKDSNRNIVGEIREYFDGTQPSEGTAVLTVPVR